MGGGWTTSTPSATRVVGTLGGAEKIPRTRVGGRPGLGTVSRRETSRTRETYLEDGVHRDAPRARPAVRSTAARAAHV